MVIGHLLGVTKLVIGQVLGVRILVGLMWNSGDSNFGMTLLPKFTKYLGFFLQNMHPLYVH